jgi:uncharacterized membrane protein YraQ (UPF0718 family)
VFGVALAMSIAGLMIGPAIMSWARGRAAWLDVLDAATLGAVLPVFLLQLVPHIADEIGGIAVVAIAGGYLAFLLLEARSHAHGAQLGAAILLPTFGIHSFLDGTTLALAFHGGTNAVGATLGAALVVHRLPEGLVIATALVPTLGVRATLVRVSALAAMTIAGAVVGSELLAELPNRALHVVVAVGLGVMLRMVVHHHHEDVEHRRRGWLDGLVFVCVAALATALSAPWEVFEQSQPRELSAAAAIVPLFLETAPWIVGALVIGELANRLVTPSQTEHCWPAGWLVAAILATFWLGPWFAAAACVIGAACVWWSSGSPLALAAVVPRASKVLPSYAVGIAVAMTVEAAVPADALVAPGWLAAPVALAIAWLAPLTAAGLVPIAAILVHKGLRPELALALVIVGVVLASREPGTPRSRRGLAAVVVAAGCALAVAPMLVRLPDLHQLGRHVHSSYEYVAAVALAAWILFELVRRGPRPFLEVTQ